MRSSGSGAARAGSHALRYSSESRRSVSVRSPSFDLKWKTSTPCETPAAAATLARVVPEMPCAATVSTTASMMRAWVRWLVGETFGVIGPVPVVVGPILGADREKINLLTDRSEIILTDRSENASPKKSEKREGGGR